MDLLLELTRPFSFQIDKRPIDKIDAVVFINLDKRPEKKQKALADFSKFNIKPLCFTAIDGHFLNQYEINKICQVFKPGMETRYWAAHILQGIKPKQEFFFLDDKCYGHSICSIYLTVGAIGCFMSHLSLIKNAYEQNLNCLWILEDDFKIVQNPSEASRIINDLEQSVGKSGWDILYTDLDTYDHDYYLCTNDFLSDLKGFDTTWFWRPDLKINKASLAKRTKISPYFLKLGSRMRTHSYIINRTGMKKILDFYQTHGLYAPYDHELALIPDMNLYSLSYDLVTFEALTSDTKVNLCN